MFFAFIKSEEKFAVPSSLKSKTTTYMPHRRIMLFYLAILLLLQNIGGGHCTVTLLQPRSISAMRGSSVNLSCQLQLNGVKVDRVNLYWLVPDVNYKVKENLYPRPRLRSTRINNSRLVYPVFINDLSLTIDDVQPSYTDTYICETSLVIGGKSQRSTGKGTYLLVYEEFMTFMNHSDIVCQVKVRVPQNVDLVWEFQGQEHDSVSSTVIISSDNSFWIISVLPDWTQWCKTQQNMTFTCKLRYTEQSLAERNIAATCAEEFITFLNHSDLICRAKLQGPQNVDLVWEFQDQEHDNVSSTVITSSDNSFWIISVLPDWTQWCQTQQNTTFTCKLRYMEQNLVERNIAATCAGDLPASYSAPQPTLLYVLILGNTLLILLIIIIITFFCKKEKKRRIRVVVPNAKFPSSSKTKYNG